MILFGTVTTAGPLRVRVDGSSTAVPALRLASYTPTVGDRVALELVGTQTLALGRLA